MVALSDSAVSLVKDILASQAMSEGSGLRLYTAPSEQREVRVTLASVPAEDDAVVEDRGVRVFLDSGASALLSDKLLDARMEDDKVAFVVRSRAPEGD